MESFDLRWVCGMAVGAGSVSVGIGSGGDVHGIFGVVDVFQLGEDFEFLHLI